MQQMEESFIGARKVYPNYQYIIAEVLLQRTKAETVAKFYPNFIIEFPNWKSLAVADVKRIEDYLKPVFGTFISTFRIVRQKKVNLLEMIKTRDRLPRNREDLESIPFIGQYIANAIGSVILTNDLPFG